MPCHHFVPDAQKFHSRAGEADDETTPMQQFG